MPRCDSLTYMAILAWPDTVGVSGFPKGLYHETGSGSGLPLGMVPRVCVMPTFYCLARYSVFTGSRLELDRTSQ